MLIIKIWHHYVQLLNLTSLIYLRKVGWGLVIEKCNKVLHYKWNKQPQSYGIQEVITCTCTYNT
jgi:hypothetical protein